MYSKQLARCSCWWFVRCFLLDQLFLDCKLVQLVEAYTIQQAWEEEKWRFLVSRSIQTVISYITVANIPTATIDRASHREIELVGCELKNNNT